MGKRRLVLVGVSRAALCPERRGLGPYKKMEVRASRFASEVPRRPPDFGHGKRACFFAGLHVALLVRRTCTLAHDVLQNAHAAFDNEPPVLCHRDFGPRNSLVDAQTGAWVGIIDFEHTRRDVRVSDFARFYEGAFLTRPDLETAFWNGYGPWPDTAERFAAQLRLCRIVQALTQIKWARTHADDNFEAQGRAALTRLNMAKT